MRGVGGPEDGLRSDAELLAETCQDPEAFGVFYQRHVDDVLRMFWTYTHDVDASGELCAETFALALEGVERYDPDRGTPRKWLDGIARHQLGRYWRRRRVSNRARRRLGIQPVPLDTTTADEIARIEARDLRPALYDALCRLPPTHAAAVRMRVVEQCTYEQIAAQLGCSPGNARVRVHRGLRRLARELAW